MVDHKPEFGCEQQLDDPAGIHLEVKRCLPSIVNLMELCYHFVEILSGGMLMMATHGAKERENVQNAAREYASRTLERLEDIALPMLAPAAILIVAGIVYIFFVKDPFALLSPAIGFVFALPAVVVKRSKKTRAFIEKFLIRLYEITHSGGIAWRICVVALAVILAAPFVLSRIESLDDGANGGTGGGTGDKTDCGEPFWSDWEDHLPADISGKNSAIECKLQYRSARLYRIENENPREEGYTILYTEYGEGYGDYTWGYSPVSENESIEVKTVTEYQYQREIEFVPPNTGGIYIIPEPTYETYWTASWQGEPLTKRTRYGVRPRHRIDICYNADEWTEFEDKPLLPNDETIINTRMQYRYAEAENGQLTENSSMNNFSTFSEDYMGRFADVDDVNAWYGAKNSDALRTVNELSILLPDSDLRFKPDDPITVGQAIRAAVMIHRIYHGYAALLGENNGQYQIYRDYAVENGIIAHGEFPDLNKAVARQELAYILSKSLPAEELQEHLSVGVISDMNSGYYDYVLGLANAGVVNLDTGNKFHPEDLASRAQTASMIDRLIYPKHRVGLNS